VVITHPHSDHFNGMDFILRHFRPKTLVINGDDRGEGKYASILEQARAQGIAVVTGRRGMIVRRGEDFQMEVLGMNGLQVAADAPVNDRSLVLKYTTGRRGFLFPSDISTRSEAVLLDSSTDLRADVLLAAHHGSATSNSKPFIAAVSPATVVVSAGKSGRKFYPAAKNLALWRQLGIRTLITRDQGTITCTTDGTDLSCTTFVQQQAAARQ
jgi:competence protein ComEC